MQAVTITQISPPELEKLLEATLKKIFNEGPELKPDSDHWFNLQELIEYLPSKPCRATVYGWTQAKKIPYHKKGKSLAFKKSEVDEWLSSGRIKTRAEIENEANKYMKRR